MSEDQDLKDMAAEDIIYHYLRHRGVTEEVIESMKGEKINMEVMCRIGQHTEELSRFLCIGDRLALRDFCARKNVFNKHKDSAVMQRKKKCYDTIRKKMKLSVKENDEDTESEADLESDEKTGATSRGKMIGNRNAVRTTRSIEFGWYHNGANVRRPKGGGTRSVDVDKKGKEHHLLLQAKQLFFPNGVSKRGIREEECTFEMKDFAHEKMQSDITVGDFCDSVKMTGKLRFYLYSSGVRVKKDISERSDSPVCRNSSDPLAKKDNATWSDSRAVTSTPNVSPIRKVDASDIGEEVVVDDVRWSLDKEGNIVFGTNGKNENVDFSDTLLEETHSLSSPEPPFPSPPRPERSLTQNSLYPSALQSPALFRSISSHEQSPGHQSQPGTALNDPCVLESQRQEGIQCRSVPGSSRTNPQISQPGSEEEVRLLRVRKTLLQEDMIAIFVDMNILETPVTFTFVDEKGVDVQGVSRDAYTCFWDRFISSSTKGEQERVPAIMPHLQLADWEAIGRILIKSFFDHGIFPIQISKSFLVAMLYGEQRVDECMLLESFMKYVSEPENKVIRKALDDDLDEDDQEEFEDLLTRLDCHTIPKGEEVKPVILQVAQTELIQQSKYALDAMASVVSEALRANLPTPQSLFDLYETKQPSCRKVIKLLEATPQDADENRVLGFLKQLIRGFTPEILVQFLHFATGARVICVEKITVSFNKTRGLARVPIARTCGPVLELSSTYASFQDFRLEFLNILSSHSGKFDFD